MASKTTQRQAGRPKTLDPKQTREIHRRFAALVEELASEYECGVNTVRRALLPKWKNGAPARCENGQSSNGHPEGTRQ